MRNRSLKNTKPQPKCQNHIDVWKIIVLVENYDPDISLL